MNGLVSNSKRLCGQEYAQTNFENRMKKDGVAILFQVHVKMISIELFLLEQHRFQRCGEFAEVNMIRALDEPIPESQLPDGYQVREVSENGEIPNRASLQREVWHPWTVGNVSDDDYARFMRLPGYYRSLDIVSVAPNGVMVAYVNGWIDPVNKIGDFGPVGALESYRRQGLTRAALLEGLRRMKAYGMNRVCISTGVSNEPAKQLYRSIGFKIVYKYLDYVQLSEKQKVG